MTFALTIVKKVVATFQNPAIYRIVSESSSALCTVRNGQAGQLSANDFLCSSFDILRASQAEQNHIRTHRISERLCNFLDVSEVSIPAAYRVWWEQELCSWSCVGLADRAAYIPMFQHWGDGNEPSWVWVIKHE